MGHTNGFFFVENKYIEKTSLVPTIMIWNILKEAQSGI